MEALLNGPEKGSISVASPTPLPQSSSEDVIVFADCWSVNAERKGRIIQDSIKSNKDTI